MVIFFDKQPSWGSCEEEATASSLFKYICLLISMSRKVLACPNILDLEGKIQVPAIFN